MIHAPTPDRRTYRVGERRSIRNGFDGSSRLLLARPPPFALPSAGSATTTTNGGGAGALLSTSRRTVPDITTAGRSISTMSETPEGPTVTGEGSAYMPAAPTVIEVKDAPGT